ncbi:MAG: 50S ribosomal protein L11 methyltransferase [Coprobacter sp.]|nr:50S ribosomal protein L11 methyltransferase [Coprobacter sp.]
MKYIETRFNITADDVTLVSDILAALLADAGYDSFVPDETGMTAYIPEHLFDESAVQQVIDTMPIAGVVSCSHQLIADKDWNEEWEKNYFKPIVIGDECVIHSTFHTDIPQAKYDILIDPKMAFGTGHHETTSLMLEWLLQHDFAGEDVLDMGCGTAILAILASMRGAHHITAIDIDSWATENAHENLKLNHIDNIDVLLGGAELLDSSRTFDTLLANINRNIHLDNMQAYASVMRHGATIYMSGFYTQDLPILQEAATRCGLQYSRHIEKNNWVAARFTKSL